MTLTTKRAFHTTTPRQPRSCTPRISKAHLHAPAALLLTVPLAGCLSFVAGGDCVEYPYAGLEAQYAGAVPIGGPGERFEATQGWELNETRGVWSYWIERDSKNHTWQRVDASIYGSDDSEGDAGAWSFSFKLDHNWPEFPEVESPKQSQEVLEPALTPLLERFEAEWGEPTAFYYVGGSHCV